MQKNSGNISMDEVKKLARSPAGQQLISILQGTDSRQLQHAAQQAASGDLEQAQKTLAPLLNSPQIQALLKQLGGDSHG